MNGRNIIASQYSERAGKSFNASNPASGTLILRFCRPLAWQNWPDELLSDELKKNNPLNIFRLVNNKWTK